MIDHLSPLPHVSNTRFRLAIKKYFYKDIEPEYTQQIKDLIVGDATETLDTLQELAEALNDDAEFYQTVTTKFDNLTLIVTNNGLVTSAALNDLNTRTTAIEENIDATPTNGSDNFVTSGGVYTALSGKANSSDLATVATSGSYNDLSNTPTIPDVSGKEDKMSIVAGSGTALTAAVNTAYNFASGVGTLAITLPTPTDTTHVNTIVFWFTTDANPNVTFTSSSAVRYHDGYELEASTMYEVNAAYNGSNWIISSIKITTS